MKKRYQIFISSTFADLKDERNLVMQAVLERKCFPAGMELFPAIDREQFEYIKKVIDDSDYYLLIIGARYGSLDENGVSFTEKEYDYAVRKGIPVIAFLHSDINSIPLKKTDGDKELMQKLEAFRCKVQTGRLVNYWKDPHELKAKVISSLVDVFDEQPKIGWIRADKVASGDAQKEIERLNNDITTYQNQVNKLEADLAKKEENLRSAEKSSKEAHQKEIKELKDQIAQLQQQCDELKAQKEQSNKDRLAIEESYQKKVNEVAGDLENVLDKLKGKRNSMELQPSVETITIPGTDVLFNMVHVEGGTFMMGADDGEEGARINEKPAHQVTLSDYYIGETQVTQALWQAVMGENPSRFKGDPNRPVECVFWADCQRFIEKLNSLTGISFRLPKEAQWEFAARGGNKSKGYKYAGGDDIDKVAWYYKNSAGRTHPVAQKAANELGLYDMTGNVWEWCQDLYGDYTDAPQTNPVGPTTGSYCVFRGGSWHVSAGICRVSYRGMDTPGNPLIGLGLRLSL